MDAQAGWRTRPDGRRRVAGLVLGGGVVAIVGASLGVLLAGVTGALVGPDAATLTDGLAVVAVLLSTAAVARWSTPALLRLLTAGRALLHRPALALAAGAGLIGPLVAALGAGATDPLGLLLWTTTLTVGTGLGAGSVPAAGRPTPVAADSGRRRDGQDGSIATEHVGVLVLIAGVVAAVAVLALPTTVGEWARYAVCTLFSDGCERPDSASAEGTDGGDDALAWTPESCTVTSNQRYVDIGVGITWVDLGTTQGYTTAAMSDDTYRVTYTGEGSVGASKGAGVWLEIYAGEESFASGVRAGAGGALRFEDGVSWDFESAEDAEAWVQWHLQAGLVPDLLDNPATRFAPGGMMFAGGRDSLFGQGYELAARGANGVLNWVGLGQDVPPEPEVAEVFTAGGFELEANAELGYLFAGDAGVEASNLTQLGTSTRSDGSSTVYLEVETSALASAGINLGPEAQAGYADSSLVAVELGEDGRPSGVDLTVHRAGDPGRDFSDVTDPRELLTGSWSASASGEPLDPSLYQLDIRLDLDPDDYDGLGDILTEIVGASGAVLPGRPGHLADALFDEGNASVVEYDDRERRFGGATGGAFSAELSGSVAYGDRDLDAVNGAVFDRSNDVFVPWACTR